MARLIVVGCVLALLGFVGLAGLAVPAWGHEDHSWVRNPRYIMASGGHCCSEQHCRPVAAGEVVATPTGWLHAPTNTTLFYSSIAIYPTEDPAGRMFRCVMGGALVCVFEGIGG
ncbi:MAG: hypothetical protein FJX60_17730 [Alphaproteobacteria bacterium]|nr:hypothetical protein [Alphaproteobacteria bacterium]